MTPDLPPSAPDESIDPDDESSVKRWAEYFGVTPVQIQEAVRSAGPKAGDVQRHLLEQGSSAGAS